MKKIKFIRKWDVLLLILLLLPLCAFFLWQGTRRDALTAVVYQDGAIVDTIDLSRVTSPYTIALHSDPAAVLQVEQGRIRYLEANCNDRLCVHAGWLSHAGAAAACLPGRTMVTLTQGQDDLVMTY